jgi:hypothetical protein
LPVRVFVTCACGAQRIRTTGSTGVRHQTPEERLALVVAAVRSGATTVVQLRQRLGLSHASVARLVGQGIDAGLLVRGEDWTVGVVDHEP